MDAHAGPVDVFPRDAHDFDFVSVREVLSLAERARHFLATFGSMQHAKIAKKNGLRAIPAMAAREVLTSDLEGVKIRHLTGNVKAVNS